MAIALAYLWAQSQRGLGDYAERLRQKGARTEGTADRAADRVAPAGRRRLPDDAGEPDFIGFAGRRTVRGFEAKVVSHGRYVIFQMAEVAIARQMFQSACWSATCVRWSLHLGCCSCSSGEEYNEARPHQGRWCFGKTPMQTFLDAMPMTKEKMIAA
jgi:hypothetical protein